MAFLISPFKAFFAVFMISCLSPSFCFAYLDPGSGSLLLSSIVAIFASVVFTAKNVFYKIKGLLSGQYQVSTLKPTALGLNKIKSVDSNQALNSIVFYCEGARYYGTFKPILDALDSLKHPYTYLTSDEGDPALKRENNNFSVKEYIGIGNSAYTRLNFLKADICVLTTPSLQVLQIKRSRAVKHYCHIVHSLTPMTYRTFGVDYFDSVLVANELQANFVREIESAHNIKPKYIAIVGSTYLDELAQLQQSFKDSTHQKDSHKNTKETTYKTILISPSWGKETLLSKYGLRLLEPLAKSPYHIIIRPHPQSLVGEVESNNIKHLQNALKDYSNVEWDIGTPNVIAFARADLMISDFSSVIFDFVCLEGKPVLTLDFSFDSAGYDLADIYDESNIDEFWTFKALKRVGDKISEGDLPRIVEKINHILESDKQKSALIEVKDELWKFPYSSGTQVAIELLKIEREILEWRLGAFASELNKIRALDSMLEDFTKTKGA